MTGVYVANVCENGDISGIYPDERRKQIENVSNPQLKLQKISSWKLLEKAVRDIFGYALEDLNFALDGNGKWTCDKLHFSLSHSNGKVAVAVSDKPVGVDIESLSAFEKRRAEKLAERIFCADEKAEDDAELLKLWTKKESIYKCFGGGAFAPNKIRTAEYPVRTLQYGGYFVSVCGNKEDLSDITIKDYKL